MDLEICIFTLKDSGDTCQGMRTFQYKNSQCKDGLATDLPIDCESYTRKYGHYIEIGISRRA